MAVYAYSEAVRHLEQAVRAQEVLNLDDKAKRCDLLLAYGEAMTYSGYSRVTLEKIAPEALRAAEALGDRTRASLACQVAFGALSATTRVIATEWTRTSRATLVRWRSSRTGDGRPGYHALHR